ncbi:hypothetical protein Tco_0677873 [Tanacetum coccineum]|uniref:Uncharacterized protein n=1 Tax=Tanacetum coccineum TaxID=301880 RepID=A0ABQ4XDH8_9ASTR
MEGAVDWKSSKKSTTVMSAREAEHIAASEAEMEAVWIRKFISRLGIIPTIDEPIKMFCDNSAALLIANEPGVHMCARHYHRRYLLQVHTDNNLANPFMKALPKGKLTQHARSMRLYIPNTPIDKKDSDFDEILDDLFILGAENLRRMGQEKVQNGCNIDTSRDRNHESDEVIQPLIPQPIHLTPPFDDYVAPATKSILDELLEDKILNVTMVDKEVDFNPTKDIEELERFHANEPQSHFTEIQSYRLCTGGGAWILNKLRGSITNQTSWMLYGGWLPKSMVQENGSKIGTFVDDILIIEDPSVLSLSMLFISSGEIYYLCPGVL